MDKEFTMKRIFINNLPDCYSKKQLIKLVKDPFITTVNVIAKQGSIDDWACYIGFPNDIELLKTEYHTPEYLYYCNNVYEADGVLSNGDKLPKDIALQLFPEFSRLSYRS